MQSLLTDSISEGALKMSDSIFSPQNIRNTILTVYKPMSDLYYTYTLQIQWVPPALLICILLHIHALSS